MPRPVYDAQTLPKDCDGMHNLSSSVIEREFSFRLLRKSLQGNNDFSCSWFTAYEMYFTTMVVVVEVMLCCFCMLLFRILILH